MNRKGWPALTLPGQVTAPDISGFKRSGHLWIGGCVYEQMDTLWAILAGIEVLLVGDSLANVKLAYASTADVTLAEMMTFT